MKKQGLKNVAELGKKTAISTGVLPCTFFMNQPKTPARLAELLKKEGK